MGDLGFVLFFSQFGLFSVLFLVGHMIEFTAGHLTFLVGADNNHVHLR